MNVHCGYLLHPGNDATDDLEDAAIDVRMATVMASVLSLGDGPANVFLEFGGPAGYSTALIEQMKPIEERVPLPEGTIIDALVRRIGFDPTAVRIEKMLQEFFRQSVKFNGFPRKLLSLRSLEAVESQIRRRGGQLHLEVPQFQAWVHWVRSGALMYRAIDSIEEEADDALIMAFFATVNSFDATMLRAHGFAKLLGEKGLREDGGSNYSFWGAGHRPFNAEVLLAAGVDYTETCDVDCRSVDWLLRHEDRDDPTIPRSREIAILALMEALVVLSISSGGSTHDAYATTARLADLPTAVAAEWWKSVQNRPLDIERIGADIRGLVNAL